MIIGTLQPKSIDLSFINQRFEGAEKDRAIAFYMGILNANNGDLEKSHIDFVKFFFPWNTNYWRARNMEQDTIERLESFVAGCNKIVREHNEKNFPNLEHDEIYYKLGKRYAKLFYTGSVFCFVDMTNGDVLKSASWKTPAKGARGNIFDEHNGLARITPYGAAYNN